MYEDFGTIINRGFYSWVRNLKICTPFILNFLFNLILDVLFVGVIGYLIFVSNAGIITDPSTLSETELLSMVWKGLSGNILLSAALILVFILLGMFVQSFFTAGAIGMAKRASETGDTVLPDMIVSGSKNALRLFLINLLISLLLLVGIIFIVPGALTIGDPSVLIHALIENPEALPTMGAGLLALGIFLWSAYLIFLNIVLSFTSYALVIDELEPLEALSAGFHYFMENKVDVFFVWIIYIGLTSINAFVNSAFGSSSILVSGLTLLLPIVVIQPLITVLYTRLYASRKGKKLYDPVELLSCPDKC
jgi:hypothetical protein